ncbi:MAG: hypothetical protein FJX67_15535 [Alphaproteobacteria bacterium]|nr:hypothetical protein [Alphaproteobacteria bacterium]
MPTALALAFAQMPDPRFKRVIWRAAGWSVVLLAVLVILAWWALDGLVVAGMPWVDTFVAVLGKAAAVVLALVLFPAAALLVVSFFLEDIVRAVEARHYPGLAAPRVQPPGELAASALRLVTLSAVLNLLVLPLYLIPVINLFVFYGLNGYLLGREYFELVAGRRMEPAAVRTTWRARRARLYLAGVVIAVLMSIPLVNWLMPVPSAAFMAHVFESMRQKGLAS